LPDKPLVLAGPAGLTIGYVIPGQGFEVLVGAEHLLVWGVGPDDVHAAAMANLAVWSAGAPWVDEVNGPTPPGSCYPRFGRNWPRPWAASGES
jgi:hypothetical protein